MGAQGEFMHGTSIGCGLAALALAVVPCTAAAASSAQALQLQIGTARLQAVAGLQAGSRLQAGPARSRVAQASAAPSRAICASRRHRLVAARMSRQIAAVLRDRGESNVALDAYDPAAGLTCQFAVSRHFDSASVVKATILAALLHCNGRRGRRGNGQGHGTARVELSAAERMPANRMITESDNDAATDLWETVRVARFRRFLALAKMNQTIPGPGGYWGLTQITARDELRLLRLLTTANALLSRTARSYELGLMSRVDPAQRWGVSAGVPAGMTVELKNGWLPLSSGGWRINSIGCVSGAHVRYCIAALSDGNPTMAYGVRTVADVARIINGALSGHAGHRHTA